MLFLVFESLFGCLRAAQGFKVPSSRCSHATGRLRIKKPPNKLVK